MSNKTYWAAIDERNEIIAIGVTFGQFDRLCFPFSNQCFARWVSGGSRYCKLRLNSLAGVKVRNIARQHLKLADFPHDKIRVSQAGVSFTKF